MSHQATDDGEPEDVWVVPGTHQFVRVRWGHYDTTYDLVELDNR